MANSDNDWTVDVCNTVNHWINICTKLSVAYDRQSDTIRLRIRRLNKLSLLIGLSSLIGSVIQMTASESLAYKIVVLVSTTISGAIASYMTIEDLAASLELYTAYNERLKIFLGEMATQVSVPPYSRVNGNKFITSNMERFQKLLTEKPNIIGEDVYYDNVDFQRTLHRQLPDFSLVWNRQEAWPAETGEPQNVRVTIQDTAF